MQSPVTHSFQQPGHVSTQKAHPEVILQQNPQDKTLSNIDFYKAFFGQSTRYYLQEQKQPKA